MAASLIPTEGGSPITLDKPIMLIGRHQECDISLQTSSKVSRRHCCIVQVGDRYVLRDLGSMNGIRVNGHRIVETELCPGDEVAVADICFLFRRDDVAPRAMKGANGVRATSAPSPVRDVSSPIAIPDSESTGGAFAPPLSAIDDPSDLKLKNDSNSAEHGFVRV